MTDHTPTPWFMAPPYLDIIYGPEHAVICREPNNPENGKNWTADAAFIVKAVNNHEVLVRALQLARKRVEYLGAACNDPRHFDANARTFLPAIDEVLSDVGGSGT